MFAWSVDEIRGAEERTGDLLKNGELMQRAARGLADVVAEVLQQRGTRSVAVVVGPGNNGGDALYAASYLAGMGLEPVVVLAASKAHPGGLDAVRAKSIPVVENSSDNTAESLLAAADVVVDGILGIGATARPNSPFQPVIDAINGAQCVVAVDVPTPGVHADLTVTFGGAKTSLVLDPEAAGEVRIVDIGLDLDENTAEVRVLSREEIAADWPVPGRHDHKYTRGVLGLVTGSEDFPGAAVLGAVAALSTGTGMVRYRGPSHPSAAVLAEAPEVVFSAGRVQAWTTGSGMDGPSERERDSEQFSNVMDALGSEEPVVVDAGALPLLDDDVRPQGAVTVLTPHAGELSTFLGARGHDVSREEIDAEPVKWATTAARESNCVVMLKGGVTIIANPDGGPCLVENRAPAWLATAGTGDVLAAMVGVLLAAGLPAQRAAAMAAYLHGESARVANPGGPVRALEVAEYANVAVARLLNSEQTDAKK